MRPSRWALGALAVLVAGCVTAQGASAPLTPRERAQVLLQKSDPAALPLIEELFAASPHDLPLARMLAEAHTRAGSAAKLLARLEGRDDAISHYQRGLILFSRAADATGPAVSEFKRACELSPKEPEFQYRLGLALLESERYEEALPALKLATSMGPERSAWSLPLAKALMHTGDTKGAVQAIREVVTHSPSPADVKTARALMDQISDPFLAFPKAARVQLEQAMQWLEVADVPQQAIVLLEEIEHDYPDLAVVHSLLGLAYARIDDAGRAVDELNRAIELAPEDGKNHLYLGELYLGRQRAKVARQHFEDAIARNPVLDVAWFRLGDLALEQQDYVTARGFFSTAVHLDPEAVPPHGKLALVYQLESNWPEAARELKAVLDREPDNVEFMLRLGLLETERYSKVRAAAEKRAASEEARKWLEKVIAAQPENALASRALERLNAP